MSATISPSANRPTAARTQTVPAPLRALLERLPRLPGSAAFAALLTIWMGRTMNAAVLPELGGRNIRIRVSDLGITLDFRATADGFVPATCNTADLTLTATAADFLRLARREEDPDTLFFSRRLAMEGDTELGLLVKNTMDAFDPAELRPHLPPPAQSLRLLRAALRAI